MKPIKNKYYCNGSGKSKMLFETEKKAENFMKFNSDIIKLETGYSPIRSYFCIYCNGWHVTSQAKLTFGTSRIERTLEKELVY